MKKNESSFRDPSGQVFTKEGKIFRSIFTPGVKDYQVARDAGIYARLITKGLLQPHEEIEVGENVPDGTVVCLEHVKLPFISYPWEWTFSMLKDAALLHLDIMEQLIPHGFWLRDASAFNVQYDGERLRLIDTLSVGQRVIDSPWVAYRQFCSHFLAPLAVAAYCDIRTLGLWRNYIDGIPLDLAINMLPFWQRYVPGLLMHLNLHARYQQRDCKKNTEKTVITHNVKVSEVGLIGIIRSLRHTIEGIKWKRSSQIWDRYLSIRTYQADDISLKTEYVHTIIQRLQPKIVWDLGANTGEFSLIAASIGAFVVSIEGDPACVEDLYLRIRQKKGIRNVLPLTMDIANPSPGLGWDNRERLGLKLRGPADMILVLALIHHLVFSNGIPLSLIAKWLSELTEYLLIEFIPPSDPMVQKLLSYRREEHLPYDQETFQMSFNTYFIFEDHLMLKNGRVLYTCRRKTKYM